ncbi:MAG: type III secretion system gatekeeper subunit SctW [Gammaproteobacteria bacterium]
MTERIQTPFSNGLAFTEQAPASAAASRGEYRGEGVVRLADAASLLDSAAEELTFGASETVEKDLSKREVGEEQHDHGVKVQVMIEQYLKKLPDLPIEKLKLFLAYLKSQPDLSSAQIREQAKREFGDVSHQYAALEFAQQSLADAPGLDGLKNTLAHAVGEILADHGPAISAGLNISVSAQTFADPRLGDVQELRDFYRATVIGFDSIADTYGAIIAKYGDADFTKALAFLLKALGDDFAAKGPSIPSAELKAIVDELYRLEVLSGMREHSHALVEATRKRTPIRADYSGHALLRGILQIKEERWLNGGQVGAIVQDMGIHELESEIYFLRGLSELVREIPLKAYQDPANRDKLRDAVQEALDEAIAREES